MARGLKKRIAPLRAWLYGRVSTRKRSQDRSPAAQLARGARLAELKGWPVVGKGTDRASSAKPDELLELARALKAIRASVANVLIVTDLDRLGGDMRQILDTAKQIDDAGAHLVIESHGIDTTQGGPIGRYFFHTMAAFAELRRTLQNDKIRRGLDAARRRGQRLGAPQQHYPTAKLIARARALRAGKGAPGFRLIARALAAEGFTVPSHATLRRWVTKGTNGQ
ncbi:MAG: recombinase family protein [Allosphingosinicella sp.]